MRSLAILGTCLALVACGGETVSEEPKPEFRTIPGLGNFAMIIPPALDPATLFELAKDHCGSERICSVYGWTESGNVARAMPMTDAEFAALRFQYSVNRNSGFEKALWDCEMWPRENKDECLSRS